MRLIFLSSWGVLLPMLLIASHPVDESKLNADFDGTIGAPSFINRNSSSLSLMTHPLGDWEHFTYSIPKTRRVLRGRIFTFLPIRKAALHYMIDGGIAQTTSQITTLRRSNIRLEDGDNPYVYRVPHCHFEMSSKLVDGKATMTYGMMKEVFQALEQLLEVGQRSFATSFVLTDETKVTWGHGEVFERSQSPSVSSS